MFILSANRFPPSNNFNALCGIFTRLVRFFNIRICLNRFCNLIIIQTSENYRYINVVLHEEEIIEPELPPAEETPGYETEPPSVEETMPSETEPEPVEEAEETEAVTIEETAELYEEEAAYLKPVVNTCAR